MRFRSCVHNRQRRHDGQFPAIFRRHFLACPSASRFNTSSIVVKLSRHVTIAVYEHSFLDIVRECDGFIHRAA